MKVKGITIKTTRDFVKTKFPVRFEEWLKSLPTDTRKLYENPVNITDWFDAKIAYYEPMDKIAEMFYKNNHIVTGEELGKFSADIALTGIYKVFLLVATPQYLMKRSSRMMETYYNPSEIEVTEKVSKTVEFKILKFDGITKATEFRFAGWCERALELCKCKNITYRITSQLSAGQSNTLIEFKWQ